MSADLSGAVRITSTAENGADRYSTSLRADVIVGADGVNSAVRSTGGFKSRMSLGSSYVRTIVRGRASPWFEEYWTPLGSRAGTAGWRPDLLLGCSPCGRGG